MAKWWQEPFVNIWPNLERAKPKTLLEAVTAKTCYCVRVCQFTFRFTSLDELRDGIDFYSRKTHRSSRLPDKAWITAARASNPSGYRQNIAETLKIERFWLERWFEKVPIRLQREGSRKRVLAALQAALLEFESQRGGS